MPILSNDELMLRPIVKSDLETLNAWKNDEEIYKFLGGGFLPVSVDIQEKWMDSLMDTTGNNKRFMILEKEGTLIGMIGLYDINWIHRTAELGLFIGDKDNQRKGYAVIAYELIERYASRYLNLRKIKAYVVKANIPAVGMYHRLSFMQAGCLKDERYIDGEYCDLLIMEKFLLGGV